MALSPIGPLEAYKLAFAPHFNVHGRNIVYQFIEPLIQLVLLLAWREAVSYVFAALNGQKLFSHRELSNHALKDEPVIKLTAKSGLVWFRT